MRPSRRAKQWSALLRLVALVAGAGACLRIPTAPGGELPCFICPTTTSLRIDGDSVVAVGDTIPLRAVAYQQNIVFQGGTIPSRTAVWTVTPAGQGSATLVVVPATADTATWGRARVVGRAPGAVVVSAREGTVETTRTLTVLPAAPARAPLILPLTTGTSPRSSAASGARVASSSLARSGYDGPTMRSDTGHAR